MLTWKQLLRPWKVFLFQGPRVYIQGWIMYGWIKGFEAGKKQPLDWSEAREAVKGFD